MRDASLIITMIQIQQWKAKRRWFQMIVFDAGKKGDE